VQPKLVERQAARCPDVTRALGTHRVAHSLTV
jgi:hypothetical protein